MAPPPPLAGQVTSSAARAVLPEPLQRLAHTVVASVQTSDEYPSWHADDDAIAVQPLHTRDPPPESELVVVLGEVLHGQALSRDVMSYLDRLMHEPRPSKLDTRSEKTSPLEPRTTCVTMTSSGCLDKPQSASSRLTVSKSLLLATATLFGILNY